jgi:hypothetical protein
MTGATNEDGSDLSAEQDDVTNQARFSQVSYQRATEEGQCHLGEL